MTLPNAAPSSKQIDALVAKLDRLTEAQKPTARQQQAAKDYADAKAEALGWVLQFGAAPKGAPCSKRLAGTGATLTATAGTITTEHPEAIGELLHAMRRHGHEELFAQLFTPRTRYDRAKEAANNFTSAKLPKRLRELFGAIFARTATESQRAPVLRIDKLGG